MHYRRNTKAAGPSGVDLKPENRLPYGRRFLADHHRNRCTPWPVFWLWFPKLGKIGELAHASDDLMQNVQLHRLTQAKKGELRGLLASMTTRASKRRVV